MPGNATQLFTFDPRGPIQPLVPISAVDVVAGRIVRERGIVPGGSDVRFDSTGETFVTCRDGHVQRYRTSDLAELETIRLSCTTGLDQSADGTTIAVGGGKVAHVYQQGAKTTVWRGADSSAMPRGVRVTPDGKRIFAITYYTPPGKLLSYNLNVVVPSPPVRATQAFEYLPHGDADYLLWTQRRSFRFGLDSVLVSKGGSRPVKVNAKGTGGVAGDIDGSTVVYQQWYPGRFKSDLMFFDLAGRKRKPASRRVNSRLWEYLPSMSRPWVLFGRVNRRLTYRSVELANLRTGRVVTLDRMRGRSPYMAPGQMNGRYATWIKCSRGCDVFRYDVVSHETVRLPNPKHEDSFGPAVTRDGTVYFGRGAGSCGRNIRLVKFEDGKVSLVMDLPPGKDFYTANVYERDDGSTGLYLDMLRCKRGLPSNGDLLGIDSI